MGCPVMGTTKLLVCYGEGFVIFFSAIITGQPLILKHDSVFKNLLKFLNRHVRQSDDITRLLTGQKAMASQSCTHPTPFIMQCRFKISAPSIL
ncbi:hypothetical protein NC651_008417 [Populus alba x Populus x berolinensis]|nr:hypothetical protein NC651_008417 [Populus alba x Populus x berolinensis]